MVPGLLFCPRFSPHGHTSLTGASSAAAACESTERPQAFVRTLLGPSSPIYSQNVYTVCILRA
jgi:hypothetical protein